MNDAQRENMSNSKPAGQEQKKAELRKKLLEMIKRQESIRREKPR